MKLFTRSLLAILLMCVLSAMMGAQAPPADSLPAADNLPTTVLGADDPDAPNVVINAPVVVKVGDMIVVDVSESNGAGFDWKVVPEPPDMRIFNDGKIMCAATGPSPIEYLFIVSCALDGKSNVKTHVVKVEANTPIIPDQPGQRVAEKVAEWCADIESPTKRDDAMKLAQAFASLATVIEGGAFDTPDEVVAATKAATRDALGDNLEVWVPLLNGLTTELKAMAQVGLLQDTESHAPVWSAVAEGLSKYAESL